MIYRRTMRNDFEGAGSTLALSPSWSVRLLAPETGDPVGGRIGFGCRQPVERPQGVGLRAPFRGRRQLARWCCCSSPLPLVVELDDPLRQLDGVGGQTTHAGVAERRNITGHDR